MTITLFFFLGYAVGGTMGMLLGVFLAMRARDEGVDE